MVRCRTVLNRSMGRVPRKPRFKAGESTVTVVGARNVHDAADLTNYTAEGVLNIVAGGIKGGAVHVSYRWSDPDPYDPEGGGGLVILCPDHANACKDAGWNKEMVRLSMGTHPHDRRNSAAVVQSESRVPATTMEMDS